MQTKAAKQWRSNIIASCKAMRYSYGLEKKFR